METLEKALKSLFLDASASYVSHGNNLRDFSNPLDVYRAHLEHTLVEHVGCEEEAASKSIQWPNNIFNGDLAVVLPRLRSGIKPDQLAVEVMEKASAGAIIMHVRFADSL